MILDRLNCADPQESALCDELFVICVSDSLCWGLIGWRVLCATSSFPRVRLKVFAQSVLRVSERTTIEGNETKMCRCRRCHRFYVHSTGQCLYCISDLR